MKKLRQVIQQILLESLPLDVKVGDVILVGRFKNKRKIVKSIGKDKYGQPTINGKSILKFKIEKLMPKKKWSAKSREELKESMSPQELESVSGIAHRAHGGQLRRDDTPYVTHPIAVQAITKQYYPDNKEAQALAMLHDIIEDGPIYSGLSRRELYSLVKHSIKNKSSQKRIVDALRIMTHSKRMHPVYEDYLTLVFSNPLAAVVKVSDLIHNLSHNPSDRQILKYKSALATVSIPSAVNKQHRDRLLGML
jgi:(p)ppGpp synthase/HD superfamily hydrolase